jgi:prepilin-type N-terminal cleavage/methylation domain-containing protein
MKSVFSFQLSGFSNPAPKGFTLVEMLVVVAVIGFLAAAVLATLTGAQLDAKDKRRISDLKQIQNALGLYYTKYNSYPRELDGANGNMSTNEIFWTMMKPYFHGRPIDPNGLGDATYYYYYDGSHSCGGKNVVVIFARQMNLAKNSNFDEFKNSTCAGSLDGEGRGGGEQSYNLIIGSSSE